MGIHDKLKGFMQDKLNKEKEAGQEFLLANKNKEGVQELPGGMQYQVLKEGTGPKPQKNSRIKAHYKGSLLNGKEFDSSYRRNQPFTAPLNALIKGWQEAIPLMNVGSTWRLWIPSDLAYGDRGAGGDIPGGGGTCLAPILNIVPVNASGVQFAIAISPSDLHTRFISEAVTCGRGANMAPNIVTTASNASSS